MPRLCVINNSWRPTAALVPHQRLDATKCVQAAYEFLVLGVVGLEVLPRVVGRGVDSVY